ncbi:MAG TPA: glycosyltransferase [Burkholderiales bacterium]|nr:glycosyltransferase [Burkholderiales bacterium]
MRILHTEASCGWGGQEIRILDESQGMAARGHELTLVAPRESRIYEAARERGLRAEALPIARKDLTGFLAMRRWLKARPVDVVNTHSSTDSWLAALACATLARSPALVRTRHVSTAISDNWPTRWLYRRATLHVVTTGEALRRQLVQDNGLAPERVTSVPTGIDVGRFVPGDRDAARRSTGLPAGRPLIGIVATLRSWKGHRYLVEAVRGMPPEVGLVIVGDGPQRPNIERSIRELGMSDRVWLAGNQRDVLPWLQSFDAFALPSYANEGVPQALVQAMLCALPCVTTTAGSISEAAVADETALVVPPEDAGALREGLRRLIEERDLRARLGAAARARCVSRFSREAMLGEMERIFREAAG